LRQGITENNIPWLDDLFLDIVVSPNGDLKLLDVDELKNALRNAEISRVEYDLAFCESNKLMEQIVKKKFSLFDLCESHRLLLILKAQVL